MKEKKEGRERGREGGAEEERREKGRKGGSRVGSTSLLLFPVAKRDLGSLSSPPKDFSILHLFCC